MEISSCNPSGTYNFEAVPRFLENISTPDLIYGLHILRTMQITEPHSYKNGDS